MEAYPVGSMRIGGLVGRIFFLLDGRSVGGCTGAVRCDDLEHRRVGGCIGRAYLPGTRRFVGGCVGFVPLPASEHPCGAAPGPESFESGATWGEEVAEVAL